MGTVQVGDGGAGRHAHASAAEEAVALTWEPWSSR